MEGESLFFAVAELSLSLAGFAALIASLRGESRSWDPINLWRVKTIIRQAFAIVFLALTLIPVFSITDVIRVTTRFGAVGLLLGIGVDAFINRHPDPTIWAPRISWTISMTFSVIYAALQLVNIAWANLGVLQLGFVLELLSPAGIFSNFVRELGRPLGEPEALGEARAER